MNNLNFKPEIYEMIATDPMLQAKLANQADVTEIDYIKELAEEKDPILTIGRLKVIVINHYNQCMPKHLKKRIDFLFKGLPKADMDEFNREIVELLK